MTSSLDSLIDSPLLGIEIRGISALNLRFPFHVNLAFALGWLHDRLCSQGRQWNVRVMVLLVESDDRFRRCRVIAETAHEWRLEAMLFVVTFPGDRRLTAKRAPGAGVHLVRLPRHSLLRFLLGDHSTSFDQSHHSLLSLLSMIHIVRLEALLRQSAVVATRACEVLRAIWNRFTSWKTASSSQFHTLLEGLLRSGRAASWQVQTEMTMKSFG